MPPTLPSSAQSPSPGEGDAETPGAQGVNCASGGEADSWPREGDAKFLPRSPVRLGEGDADSPTRRQPPGGDAESAAD